MFLSTKAHIKEIVDGQFRIRLGNRVPKDAVNLAYTHIPAINSDENVLITDLSNTILENSRNENPSGLLMYPDTSLLLRSDSGQIELPTEDVLITNIFKDNVPLYYSYRLSFRHFDKSGPDSYGIYHRDGIAIIDRYGKPITRPYQVQLVKDNNNLNLYYVVIYTSFKDQESDSYRVIYNAVNVNDDGTIETNSGHREALNLQRAFSRVNDINELTELIRKKEIFPAYYQANGERIGHSKVFVPTPRIKDTRTYEKFRYQVGLEIEMEDNRVVYTTPWYSDSVLNFNDLTLEEQKEYVNGFKQITQKTAEQIMKGFVPYSYFQNDPKKIRRYFVNIDNPRVSESLRMDGSSPVYMTTTSDYKDNTIFIPMNSRTTRIPVRKETSIKFKARPLYASDKETAYISFVIDNSESMGVNDADKILRFKIMESILYSANSYYKKNRVNGIYFSHLPHEIRKKFATGDVDIINIYEEDSFIDSDVTRPIPAIDESLLTFKDIPNTYMSSDKLDAIELYNRKFMILVTDGEFSDMAELQQKVQEAKLNGISLCVITWHNYDTIKPLVEAFDNICIDAKSPRLAMELRYFFFRMAGLNESISLGADHPFSMTPDDNDMTIYYINPTSFVMPDIVLADEERYGIEIELDDSPSVPELSIYLEDVVSKEIMPTQNSAYVITLEMLQKKRTFKILARSEAWQYYFTHTYSVQFNDKQKIQLLPPREKDSSLSWYPLVRNGRFDRSLLDRKDQPTYHYSIPEYYRQSFLEDRGYPYRQVLKERPQVINNHQLRVRHTPIFVEADTIKATNIKVKVNDKEIRVISWNAFDGIMEVDGTVTNNDEIFVDYQYEEESYVYRGYYSEEDKHFWHLDLNPTKGHYVTIRDDNDGQIKDVDSFVLINKTVYVYMMPSSLVDTFPDGTLKPATEILRYTLFHSFEKVTDKRAILIGEIRVRPNSNQRNLTLYDTRTRGGGLKESITPEIMAEFEEESFFYWDIGHWDGEPFPENGVITVRISQSVLKEHGGQFTKPEIEDKLNRYLGYGILPIIEYVNDPDMLLQIPEGLVVEVFDVEELGEVTILKPTFDLSLGDV